LSALFAPPQLVRYTIFRDQTAEPPLALRLLLALLAVALVKGGMALGQLPEGLLRRCGAQAA